MPYLDSDGRDHLHDAHSHCRHCQLCLPYDMNDCPECMCVLDGSEPMLCEHGIPWCICSQCANNEELQAEARMNE